MMDVVLEKPAIISPLAGKKCVIIGTPLNEPPAIGVYDDCGRCVFENNPHWFRPAGPPEGVFE